MVVMMLMMIVIMAQVGLRSVDTSSKEMFAWSNPESL
jgi:hypothetical protein